MKLSSSLFIIVLFLRTILDKCLYIIQVCQGINICYIHVWLFLIFGSLFVLFCFHLIVFFILFKEPVSFFGIFVEFFVWGGALWFGLFKKQFK